MRSPALENGGFMTTAVGLMSRDRMLCSCSAFSAVMRLNGRVAIMARRCAEISLPTTLAPAFMACTAIPPVPADGSITTSPGRRFAAQEAAKA